MDKQLDVLFNSGMLKLNYKAFRHTLWLNIVIVVMLAACTMVGDMGKRVHKPLKDDEKYVPVARFIIKILLIYTLFRDACLKIP